MAEIKAELVKQLREITGAGMMDCKRALIDTNGDIDTAVENLRKAGIAKAAKKLDRESKEGRVEGLINSDRSKAVIVELSSETDFVARNEEFIALTKRLAEIAFTKSIGSVEKLSDEKIDGQTISEKITAMIAKIGENIKPKRVSYFEAPGDSFIYQYIHPGNKIAVMVELAATANLREDERIINLAKELALQITFSKPVAICRSEVPRDVADKEKKLYEEQAREEGKPEQAIEKIVEGRTRKFFEESCLLEQEYIRNVEIKVDDLVAQISKEVGSKIVVKRYTRFEVGTI